MLSSLVLLILSLFLVIKSADFAVQFSTKLAKNFQLSKYTIGFIVVAIISILPETLISVTSALEGIPSFGLGTLYGSNVADLTVVFAMIIIASGKNIKVKSRLIKNGFLHTGALLFPIALGLNGHYSRTEGLLLIMLGVFFFLYVLKKNKYKTTTKKEDFFAKNFIFFALSICALLLGAHLTIGYSMQFANNLRINPIFIGMFIVSLGTTLPELFFSFRAVKKRNYELALGDILGTVIADATIVVGITAVISPFSFDKKLVYVTGIFMVLASALLFYFMKSDKILSKKEAFFLLLFYTAFVMTEMLVSGL